MLVTIRVVASKNNTTGGDDGHIILFLVTPHIDGLFPNEERPR